jgi:hypothetical protein
LKKLGFPLLVGAVVAGLIGLFVIGNKNVDTPERVTKVEGEEFHEPSGNAQHIAEGASHDPYSTNPPTSGPHYANWTDAGIKDSQLPDEVVVHNLEHGYIVINYRPDLPPEQVEELKRIFNSLPNSPMFNKVKAVMMPRAQNEHAISLTAWGYLLHMNAPSETKIKQFYEAHVDQGPEQVP